MSNVQTGWVMGSVGGVGWCRAEGGRQDLSVAVVGPGPGILRSGSGSGVGGEYLPCITSGHQ